MLDVELKRRVIRNVRDMYTMNENYTLTNEEREQWGDFLYNGWKYEIIEKGIKETALKMIKGMLKKEMSYQDISDISGDTVEEIKEIEKSMKK